ncbi:MAG: hypothetical protein JSW48_09330 [Betaproteobacteria bacterium]|nr:MAG: hypothetical protein JSW48_09330 [Betaproteobacteria bacterium]
MRTLTLLIRTLDTLQFADNKQRYPALEAFFSRCLASREPDVPTSAWACARFGIERQYDWPTGAILARAHGAHNGSTFWICAQPVHLAVDRDGLVLQPRSQLNLSEQESRTLFRLLEPHLAGHELEMKHIGTGLWCVGSKRSQHLVTNDIELAEGHSVDRLMPSGNDAAWWQRLVLEAQMILHEHAVNVSREERGDLPVNSLWLWGGGTEPAVHRCFDKMSVRDPLLRAAALLSQARLIEMPNNALDMIGEDEHVLVETMTSTRDGPGTSLSTLESDWIAPSWKALNSGRLDQLCLVLPLTRAFLICHCDRKARRSFWKRRQAVPQFLSRWQVSS